MKNVLPRSEIDDRGTYWFIQRGGARQRAKIRTCPTCSEDFATFPHGGSRFCSPDCYRKQCQRCGEVFKPSTPRAVYCSPQCKQPTAICEQCGIAFRVGKGSQGKFCSLACFYDFECPVGTVRDDASGYRIVKVPPGTPGVKLASRGRSHWMWEHRYVMQQVLGRPLETHETAHHINGKRADNRPENLELWKRSQPAGVRSADYHCPGCRCHELDA